MSFALMVCNLSIQGEACSLLLVPRASVRPIVGRLSLLGTVLYHSFITHCAHREKSGKS